MTTRGERQNSLGSADSTRGLRPWRRSYSFRSFVYSGTAREPRASGSCSLGGHPPADTTPGPPALAPYFKASEASCTRELHANHERPARVRLAGIRPLTRHPGLRPWALLLQLPKLRVLGSCTRTTSVRLVFAWRASARWQDTRASGPEAALTASEASCTRELHANHERPARVRLAGIRPLASDTGLRP